MVFQLTPGTEAPSEMNVYFPQLRMLNVAENVTHNMHNLYTLRGAEIRDAIAWSGYIEQTRELFGDKSDVMIAQHHWPVWGRGGTSTACWPSTATSTSTSTISRCGS